MRLRLDVPQSRRDESADPEHDGPDQHDEPGGKHGTGTERERDADDLEQRAARL